MSKTIFEKYGITVEEIGYFEDKVEMIDLDSLESFKDLEEKSFKIKETYFDRGFGETIYKIYQHGELIHEGLSFCDYDDFKEEFIIDPKKALKELSYKPIAKIEDI